MKLIPTPKHVPAHVRFIRLFALNAAIILCILALCGYPHAVVTPIP